MNTIYQAQRVQILSPPDKGNPYNGLQTLADQSNHVLLNISGVFPFDLFPDSIIVDENKVRIIQRSFPGIESVTSILLENVTDVEADISPFFGSIIIRDASYFRYPRVFTINYLKKNEALEASNLIQGLIAAKKTKTNFSRYDLNLLKNLLENIGDLEEHH